MKKLSFGLLFSILAIVLIVSAGFAAGTALPGSGWFSGEQIQNVGTAPALITITAYSSSSSDTYTIDNQTINPGEAATYLPDSFTDMPAGFQGSAIVSSDQDIRAIVNVTNRYLPGLGFGDDQTPSPAAGQYQGMNVPDTTINFPLAKNDHYQKTTTFFIQNAGSEATTVRATFIFPTGTYIKDTPSINPGQMVVVTPNDATDSGGNPPPSGNGQVGSMTATSTASTPQNLAGTMMEHYTAEAHATVAQATRAFTAADYDTTIFAPINKNNFYGRFTGLQVQNVSDGPVDVTVSYKQSANTQTNCPGGTKSDSFDNLAVGASHSFPSTILDPGCLAAATVTAQVHGTGSFVPNIVGLVNESYMTSFLDANPGRYQESTSYGALPLNSATNYISMPLYKEYAYGKGTGITIQNVTDTAAHVKLTFTGPTGTYVSAAQTIDPGANIVLVDVRNKPAAFWDGTAMTPAALGCTTGTTGCGANGTFGVVVESLDQPIVSIANESTYPFTAPLINQDKSNYEGFNLDQSPLP